MRRSDGFTLIEVLVAMVVAVAALAVLSQGFGAGARASSISQNTTRAALLAQQVLTDIEVGALSRDQGHSGAFESDPEFSYETRSEIGELELTLLTIRILWSERGQDREYVLTRLLRERLEQP